MSKLPADVVLMICEELENLQNYGSLLSYALACKTTAGPALSSLYRSHNQFIRSRNEEAEVSLSRTKTSSRKWAVLWRSLLRSSLGGTAYPYCLYIRSLDLRDLENLLDDASFQNSELDSFFADDMSRFLSELESSGTKRTRSGGKARYRRLNNDVIIERAGSSITNFVSMAATNNGSTVALEEISGRITSNSLLAWLRKLDRLRGFTLYDGDALTSESGDYISRHCPNFNDVTFYRGGEDSDIGQFFKTLSKNSIQSFVVLSAEKIGSETLMSLDNHSTSLRTLKLNDLNIDILVELPLLHSCTSLEILKINSRGNRMFPGSDPKKDDVDTIITWLGQCDRLRELEIRKSHYAHTILAQVLLRNNIRLRSLELDYFLSFGENGFSKALAVQSSLETLKVKISAFNGRPSIESLITSISQLTALRELDIGEDEVGAIENRDIIKLASNLPSLEKLSFSGRELRDEIFPALSRLHYLQSLTTQDLSYFTVDGLLSYISKLQPTNKGLVLSVMSQYQSHDINDERKAVIQHAIEEKVDGKFEFVLFREADSEFDSDSD